MVSNPNFGFMTSVNDLKAKRNKFRRLLHEDLERRELMAGDFAGPVFGPGTSEEYKNEWIGKLSGPPGGGGLFSPINVTGRRWTDPVGGPSPTAGESATVTWSIIPDGTTIKDQNFNDRTSNLVAFLDGIYGSAPGPISNRPWFQVIERSYENWSRLSGINFVYEPNDDGAVQSASSRGVLGVRGDARVGGCTIDGNSNILAFNYFPNQGGTDGFDGDMVIDTADNFYPNNAEAPSAENRAIVNVFSHELGHGIGLGHVDPTDETKLMEPFISLQYLGTQHDDILGANTEYGDSYEPNDTRFNTTDLGELLNTTVSLPSMSINRVNNLPDADWFRIQAASAGRISLSIDPVGFQYLVGPSGGGVANVDTLRNMDLSILLEDAQGNLLADVNLTGLGQSEVITDLQLPSAGEYFFKVDGVGLDAQLYALTLTSRGFSNVNSSGRQPRLLSVSPNSGEIFNLNRINLLQESPSQLVFRFDGSQRIDESTLSGIKISRSGGDNDFNDGDEVVIDPAWIGFGDTERIVIARFGSPLPDDVYKIEVLGVDLASEGRSAIKNEDGKPLRPRRSGTDRDTFFMNLELGSQVIAVVPQPVVRNVLTGALTQQRNRIEVYFNDDDLHATAVTTVVGGTNPTVVDPAYYQLVSTKDTVNPNDDVVFNPSTITYDPATDKAILTFSSNIDSLVGGAGTFRLRIGSKEQLASLATPSSPTAINPGVDPGDTLTTANNLGTFAAAFSAVISENVQVSISNQLNINFPGGNIEPGHRDIQASVETHLGGGDDDVNIKRITYSFSLGQPYGIDPTTGRPYTTSINPEQIARVREVFEFYSTYLGVDFVETEGAADLTIVVGDMAPLNQQSGPGQFAGVAGAALTTFMQPTAIMDGAENWDNGFGYGALPGSASEFSTGQGPVSFFIVAMHEIGHLLGLEHSYEQPPGTIMGAEAILASNPLEWAFPGDIDVVHGQHIHRPDNRDTDLYRFVIPAGQSGQVTAETFAERLNDASNLDTHLTLLRKTTSGLEVVGINDNYFSDDSLVRANLTPGEYFIAVTAKGNETFDPLISGTGSGGVSQGRYELRLSFKPTVSDQIVDSSGTQFDGDGDGKPGGNFDFWFRAAAPVTTGVTGGPKTIYVDKQYTGASIGSLDQPFRTIPSAAAVARDGDIIRIAATSGVDRNLLTLGDNRAYEIGDGGIGKGTLSDGKTLDVPKGVTLMIESGAIFKFGGSSIVVGSSDASTDRSGSAIQVLGIPGRPVHFTSYFNEAIGFDTNPLSTSPAAGNWGGIELRQDSDRAEGRRDREQEGVFLNYIAHGSFTYGGGQVGVGNQTKVVAPVHMTESRPTLLYNDITLSADAGMSADPDSFEETLFTHDRYQLASQFTPDYSRVGPVVRGNTISDNSLNGLSIRVDTLAGNNLKPLSVAGRLDDTDVTYILGENLIINGTPGGNHLETARPDVSVTQVVPATGGSLVLGRTYSYVVTFVDKFGGESLPSVSTISAVAGVGRALQLRQLPVANGDFVGRRIWRSTNNGAGPFELVANINQDVTIYTDTGASIGGTITSPGAATKERARTDASLVIDPGIVIKALGTRIEVGIGATLIAEGGLGKPVIFTSRLDDRYGASGTFDTNNDDDLTSPDLGDWGGIVARHLSSVSIDTALVTFGGGTTSIPGGFASFNAIEIHQANARIANSVIENNASGRGSPIVGNRDARGFNDNAVIFVTGSQPIIVNNTIRGSDQIDAAAISIDANSLKAKSLVDYGRTTGDNSRVDFGLGNMGPLVRGNFLGNNGINGMRVRGATLTTESTWDDTDIVHVLQSVVVIPDFHTYGGLRLQSKANESLVVKLSGTAGITAAGRPLDIPGRIGGSLQILGAPGFPVVLTSLRDDSIGAGFDSFGNPQKDTDGSGPTSGSNGEWRSIRLDAYSNDRNVETAFEFEADKIQDEGVNDIPGVAQDVGQLASSIREGDENLRLGFTIHGSIAAPSDLDVFRFTGVAGTPVWFDIDQTGAGLDSVVEIIDGNGNILAQSDNSLAESLAGSIYADASVPTGRALPMDQNAFIPTNTLVASPVDFQTINPLDAGFRITLPGVAGTVNPYFVRVRSSNIGPGQPATRLQDPALTKAGITTGPYRLQVRMQHQDETAGSTVRFADIRFATNGIEVLGLPGHSPLIGETAERAGDTTNEGAFAATPIGNIANTDRSGISIAGGLANRTDVDWFGFSIFRDSIQQPGNRHIATSFDIDYADALGRGDTTLWVFQIVNNNPQLVLVGTDSDIADDQAAPGQGTDWDDLSRGSAGSRDAFIGSQELPDGDYLVAVSNSSLAHQQMNQFTLANAANPELRVEPLLGFQRVSEDRFDPTGPENNSGPMQVSFASAAANAVPWTLADVTLYVARSLNGGTQLRFGNALTGAAEANVSQTQTVTDIAAKVDGTVWGYIPTNTGTGAENLGAIFDFNSGSFVRMDSRGNGTSTEFPLQQIQTTRAYNDDPTDADGNFNDVVDLDISSDGNRQGRGLVLTAMAWASRDNVEEALFAVGSRAGQNTYIGTTINPNNGQLIPNAPSVIRDARNFLFRFNEAGQGISPPNRFPAPTANNRLNNPAGSNIFPYAHFAVSGTARITGLAEINNVFWAVASNGELFSVNLGQWTDPVSGINPGTGQIVGSVNPLTTLRDPDTNQPITFTSLTAGPRNVEGGKYLNILFGATAAGTIYAINTATRSLEPIFPRAKVKIEANPTADPTASLGVVQGIDFSSMDVNLWHNTDLRAGLSGHGQQATFDGAIGADQGDGGRSLHFGFQDPNGTFKQPGIWSGVYDVPQFRNSYDLPGGASGAIESNPIDLRGFTSDDQPMLYFNYWLDTEGKNANASSTPMLDALRVYGAGPDGAWQLISTNNSADNGVDDQPFPQDEYDSVLTGYTDRFGRNYRPQELFDQSASPVPFNFRQARVSLAPFAGLEDVRLRFEFSTQGTMRTGDSQRGGVELTAVLGTRINDGDTFEVTDLDGVTTTFEFDLGLVLELPSGASVAVGDRIRVQGQNFIFVTAVSGPNQILFAPNMTAEEIATSVSTALTAAGFVVVTNPESPAIINVTGGVTPAGLHSVTGLDPATIIGRPGVAAGNAVVTVNHTMSRVQVRDAIRTSLAATLNEPGEETNIDVWQVYHNTVRLYGFTIDDPGPLGATVARNGDAFGAGSMASAAARAQNNFFGGVHVDDIIIGFAERGEMVHNFTLGQFGPYEDNDFLRAGGMPGTNPSFTGTYQLEVRSSATYGTSAGTSLNLFDNPFTPPREARTFSTNDRLAKSASIFVASSGAIPDGTQFTLSDGVDTVAFEFDVVKTAADRASGVTSGFSPVAIEPGASANQIATSIRDAVNVAYAQGRFKISASTLGQMSVLAGSDIVPNQSPIVSLFGDASVTATGSMTFTTTSELIAFQSGVDSEFGEDLGDTNIYRDQGEIIISSNSVYNSSGVGILVDAGARARTDLAVNVGPRPYPGSPRNLVTLNPLGYAPGTVVVNNIVANNQVAGIRVSGDGNTVNSPSPSSIARVINNTVYGISNVSTGIVVDEAASPTLLNNVVANNLVGISIDPTSASTVQGGNLFKSNPTRVLGSGLGSFPIDLVNLTDPLFIDPTNGRFYLEPLSRAIDSSLASLGERFGIASVRSAIGLPTSPMIAPSRDVFGLLRADDPNVNTPGGQGQNVFIDRGAVDRTDFLFGPKAILLNPLDNDSAQVDSDRTFTNVRILDRNLNFFSILIQDDRGSGPDPKTITADSIILTENGRLLIPDVDYVFGYSASSTTVRLTPLSGLWRRDSVYEITLVNAPSIRVDAPVGNTISDGDQISLTLPNSAVVNLEFEGGYSVQVPQTLTLVVPENGSGPTGILDGQQFTISRGTLDAIFEFDTDGIVTGGSRPLPIPPIGSATQVRDAILATLTNAANADLNLAPKAVDGDRIHLGSVANHSVDVAGTLLVLEGVADGVADGDSFSYTPVGGTEVRFEFNRVGDTTVGAGNIPISFLRTETHEELAVKVATALAGLVSPGFAPVQHVGDGRVHVGGLVGDLIDISSSTLTVDGQPGLSESLQLTVPSGGAGFTDGQKFSIRNGNRFATFEFTKDLTFGAGNRPISITDTDTDAIIAGKIVNAIRIAGLAIVPTANGALIDLNEPLGTILDLLDSPLTVTGSSGGPVKVDYVPGVDFTNIMMAGQITKSINTIGLGVKAVAVGDGSILLQGVSSVSGASSIVIGPIADIAGNWLQANRDNSLTQFTIIMPEAQLDYGDASGVGSQTLQADNGARHVILPEDEPRLVMGNFVDADADGQPDAAAQGDDMDAMVTLGSLPMRIANNGPAQLQMPAPSAALVGQYVEITDAGLKKVVIEFTAGGATTIPGAYAVNIATATTSLQIANRFSNAVLSALLAGDIDNVLPVPVGSTVSLAGTVQHLFDLTNSPFVRRISGGRIELGVRLNMALYADGQFIIVSDGASGTVRFELNDPTLMTPVAAGSVGFDVNLATATPSDIAASLAAAINQAVADRVLLMPAVTVSGETILLENDDEGGVRFDGLFNENAIPVPVYVTASNPGMLDAWFDWNADGDFTDAGERMLSSLPVLAGENLFYIQTPARANIGFLNSRFRLSTSGGLLTSGVGLGGEVEDHLIEVLGGSPPTQRNDSYSVPEDGIRILDAASGVLRNDVDVDGNSVTVLDMDPATPGVQIVSNPIHGTLTINTDGSFTYEPEDDFFGTDSFVYYAFDGRMRSNQAATVTINVTPVNDRPTAIDDTRTILEDVVLIAPGSDFWSNDIKGPINESGQILTLINARIISPRGNGEDVTVVNDQLIYTPPLHYNNRINGPVLVELTIRDSGVAGGDANPLEDKSILTINLSFINDAPVYSMPGRTSTTEDAGLVTVANFVRNILPGPALASDEVDADNQIVTFQVRALDPSLFAVQPVIFPNGTLRYRLAPDVNNVNRPNPANLRVEVIAVDDGPSSPLPNDNEADPRTFTITVPAVNDAPEFTLPTPAEVSTDEDGGPQTITSFATGIRPGPITADDEAGQVVTFFVTAADPTAFKTQPKMASNGTLTFELAKDVNSLFKDLRVFVYLKDNGPFGGSHVNVSPTKTFTIVAADINDAPNFSLTRTQVTVLEDNEAESGTTPTRFPAFFTNIVKGPATALDEERDQTVQFQVVSNTNASLFSVQPAIDPTGNLTFTTAKDQNGVAVIVVKLVDSGRSAPPPNDNDSANKTFTINLRAVNDAPEFTIPSVVNVIEDQGLVRINNFATGLRPGPITAPDESGQEFTVNVAAVDPTRFLVQPTIAADGTLQFQTRPDVNIVNANLAVTVYLQDNGLGSAPNVNRSATRTFTINAAAINDAPSFGIQSNSLIIDEDRETYLGIPISEFPGYITNIAMGPPTATDEFVQVPTFTVSNTSPELFSIQPTVRADGTLVFKTSPNKSGRATFVIQMVDDGVSGPSPNTNVAPNQTITVTITAINDPPEFTIPATLTSNEDEGVVSRTGFATRIQRGPLSATDESNQEVQFVVRAIDPSAFSQQPTMTPDGRLTYKTAVDVNRNTVGKDLRVKVFLVDDGANSPLPNNNRSPEQTFTVLVNPINDPPIPDSFSANANEDGTVTIQASGVIAGDVPGPADETGQSLFMTQVERSSDLGGIVEPVFSGGRVVSFKYTPPINVVGTDYFRYVVTDDGRDNNVPAPRSATGTITITILGINDPPQFTAGGDQIVLEDAGVVTTPWATNVAAGPPGALDENTGPSKQTVSFTVTTNRPGLFEVQPTVAADGKLSFKTAPNGNGTAVVTVVAVDSGSGVAPNINRSAPATFTINVTPVNDAPVFTPGGAITIDEDAGPTAINWATGIFPAAGLAGTPATANDEASQQIVFEVTVDKPQLFSVQPTINAQGRLSFTPAQNAFGVAKLSIIAKDNGPSNSPNVNQSVSRTLTLTINQVNDAPVGVNDSYSIDEDSVLSLPARGVLGNDIDADMPNDVLKTVEGSTQSNLGATVVLRPDGSFTYTPTAAVAIQRLGDGETINDFFTYKVQDANGVDSNLVTVNILVSGRNDAPVAKDDTFAVVPDRLAVLAVLSNDTDVDSNTPIDERTITIGQLPINGTIQVLQTGFIEYRPNPGFRGEDTFTYRVRDSLGLASNEALVTVTTNSPPVAVPDTVTTALGTRIVFDVTTNDFDSDGAIDRTSVQIVSPATSGSARVLSDGRIEYTPTASFIGTATLSYTVRDNEGSTSNSALVSIRVGSSLYQNPRFRFDVNDDGFVSPIDALLIVNDLNKNGIRTIPPGEFVPPPYIDVDGNRRVEPKDVLEVINYLNTNGPGSGGGEGEGQGSSVDLEQHAGVASYVVTMVSPEQMLATVGPQVRSEAELHLQNIIGRSCSALVGEGEGPADSSDWNDHLAVIAQSDDRAANQSRVEDVFASDLDDLLS